MPRRKNWRAAEAKRGANNPKKQRLTDLTGDTGPINSTKFDLDMGDTDTLNNSNSNNMGDTDLHSNINNNNLNQNSNNCAKETSQIQTDILLNKSNKSYAKKDFHSNIQNDLLQNHNEQTKNNSELEVSKKFYSFNAHFLRFGTFDQYATKFDDESRGNQCTCNSLVFLSLSTINFDPNTLNLDYILNKGDEIYRKHVRELKTQGLFKNMLLNFDEIPVEIEISEGIFTINKLSILFGIALQYKELSGFLTLQEAIKNCITQSNKFLIMIGAICSAVYYCNQVYYFFDPHSHSECTLNNSLDSSGKSILIGFADLYDLVSYLYAFYTSLQIDLDSQYEILPVSIHCKDTEIVLNKQIKNYFEDQKLRNTKQKEFDYQYTKLCGKEHSVSNEKEDQAVLLKSQVFTKVPRFEYMKTYMQNRRTNKTYREKEKQKDLIAKRYLRKDKDFKKREVAAKRNARKNEDFRKRELGAKREIRKDVNFRKAEAESKKSRRNNFDLRQIERQREIAAKRNARMNEDFRKRELGVKREIRKDVNFRKAEAKSKKSRRNNFDFRQRDKENLLLKKRLERMMFSKEKKQK
ncbi:unnamed protein product [Mytilus coruscus]|uniref:Peptidase C76 domain-containing protein n=1 Tax=Mytilus coruscus TaxID=42192 RepID=A0A6J8C858_MYTCO|nr:unnamed protein product [Mytilus coruscus]